MNNQIITYINILGIFIISFILLGAYYFQFALHEHPCPLCLLQRACFFGVIFGLFLNVRLGFSPAHYGFSILSALLGGLISSRQILLHICPTTDDLGYGTPAFGIHLYSWALIAFITSIVVISILLLQSDQFSPEKQNETPPSPFADLLTKTAFGLTFILVATNTFFTFMECGFGFCPDDPISYMILHGEWW